MLVRVEYYCDMPSAGLAWCVYENGVDFLKLNIKHRVLLWGLFASLLTFLLAGAIYFYSMSDTKDAFAKQGAALGDDVAESVGQISGQDAKERLLASAVLKARHIDRELVLIGEDVEYMADRMSMLLTSPNRYPPRTLQSTRDSASITSGTPYIHFSPTLSNAQIESDLAEEIETAGNIADTLSLMSRSYSGYRSCFFVVSRKGYSIYLDITADGKGNVLPDGEAREDMLSGFDPRERSWYEIGRNASNATYTAPYAGIDGLLNINCVVPYYDADGFAGVAGIVFPMEEAYRQIAEFVTGTSDIVFAVDRRGEVAFSSLESAVLTEALADADAREAGEESFAAAIKRMTAGERAVVPVTLNGEAYYLAFAPMPSIGWSFGTLVKTDKVMAPAVEARKNILDYTSEFQATLEGIFADTTRNAFIALVIAALLLLIGSETLASRITNPIRKLADGVRTIAGGNLEYRLDVKTGDEIELLANSFNNMTEELSAYMKNLERTTAEKERIKTELDLARNIQDGMLPKDFPHQKEFDLIATMHPAKEVGGDFYDFYFLDETHLAVTVADVSDKGIPAALFMVIAKTLLKDNTVGAKNPEKLSEAVAKTNEALISSNQEGMFVTAFCGILDLKTGEFIYANAGHNPPLIRHGTEFSYFKKSRNLVLGIMPGEAFETETITLAPGDAIFIYTDGVTEALDTNCEMFRENRLKETLDSTPEGSDAAGLVSAVKTTLESYTEGTEQSDDITMLALVYHGNNGPKPS